MKNVLAHSKMRFWLITIEFNIFIRLADNIVSATLSPGEILVSL